MIGNAATEQLMAAVDMPSFAEGAVSHRATTGAQARLDRPNRDGAARPPARHPPGEGDALRRLPLRPGRARQHQAPRRGPRGHRDPVHRLPRHRRQAGDACSPPGRPSYTSGRRSGKAGPQPGGAAHARRAAPVRAAGRQDHPELDGRARPGLGGRPDRRHHRPRSRRTTTSKSHLAKTVRFDADGQIVWGDLPGGERERLRPRQRRT